MEKKSSLESQVRKSKIILREIADYSGQLLDKEQFSIVMGYIVTFSKRCLDELNKSDENYKALRHIIDNYIGKLLKLMNALFVKVKSSSKGFSFSLENWQKKDSMTFLFSSYILFNKTIHLLRNEINKHFIRNYKAHEKLVVDENSPLWDLSNMEYHEFSTDALKIKEIAKMLIEKVKSNSMIMTSMVVLQEQVGEIVKNAMRHGNKLEPFKKVKVWNNFDSDSFRIIVEDEGGGFHNLEEWNDFNQKRNEAIQKGNMEEMMKYIQYKTEDSNQYDGGNSLFAALEYWDSGLIYNQKRNKVVAVKYVI